MAAKGIIPKSHQKFIKLISTGVSQVEAYSLSFPRKNLNYNVAGVEGHKLSKRYAKQIAEANDRQRQAVIDAYKSEAVKEALKEILTQAEVDAILSKKIKALPKILRDKKTGKALGVDNTSSDNLRAIDLFNKRFGSNAPVKTELSGSGAEVVIKIGKHK